MSDIKTDPPSPDTADEITRKLEEFIKNSLGGQVVFTKVQRSVGDEEPPVDELPPSGEEPAEEDTNHIFDFKLKPADVKAYLDRFVIQQDEAKKGPRDGGV